MGRPRIVVNVIVVGVLIFLGAAPSLVFGQEADQSQGLGDEQMAAWMKASSPGEHHKHLDAMRGSWQTTVSMWQSPDQAEPTVTTGTSVFEWVLGGRYLRQDFKGTFMDMPFEGLGYTGYDNAAGHYVAIWMDNFGTGMATETGKCDGEGQEYKFTGSYVDPITGSEQKTRSLHRSDGPDRRVVVTYGLGPDGKEFKMMEIVYTR